jgi:hypothetical protein
VAVCVGGGKGGQSAEPKFIVNVSAMEGKFYRYRSTKHATPPMQVLQLRDDSE